MAGFSSQVALIQASKRKVPNYMTQPQGPGPSPPALIRGRNQHTATLLANGKVLVAGGGDNLATAELYDPATGTWTFTGSLNAGRGAHTAALLSDGKVLVAGGGDNLATAELYDPATGTWTFTGSLNAGRYLHTSTLLTNGRVLIAGGLITAMAEARNSTTRRPELGPSPAASIKDGTNIRRRC